MAQPDTETKQREFRKELGLRNLVMCQILNIVGVYWVGLAATLGPPHVAFWLLGITLFYLPSAAVVIYLNRTHTLEGGLYEWARLGFNQFIGFLVGWNMWLNIVSILSYAGIQASTMLAYALGPKDAWIAQNKWALAASTSIILGGLIVVAIVGLRLGKWIQDLGGAFMMLVFLALIALPFRNHLIGRPTLYPALTLALPALTLLNLNILGKMSFGAMSGFDSMAIFAGECRDAASSISRSVIIAAPLIAAMFVLGTSSVVALVPKGGIDLVSPIPQALALGTRPGDPGASLIPLAILALLFAMLASMALTFACATRLPLVAGWDRLLPEWFGRLHPRRKTPTNSILFVGAVAFAMAMAGVSGAGQQEAFQLLQNTSGIFYAIAYLAMFALPLAGKQRQIAQPPLWLRAASVSGFVMTAMYLALSIFPIIDVPHPLLFTAKVGGFVLACELAAALLYVSYRRKSKVRAAETASVSAL
ncbi:MAG TPA: APC family permease [Bryobacteraceae bacterium]|nr:APC family permease [Bryobacteraceae bacterium]